MNKHDVLLTSVFWAIIILLTITTCMCIKAVFIETELYMRIIAYVASIIFIPCEVFIIGLFLWLIDWNNKE